jgi:CheY-like chemotaxis protein
MKVLIVEDDLDARETMRFILERAGFEVDGASDGREALAALRGGGRPCLILLDLGMPVMDGWAFLSALESDGELAQIPIVVVSARTDGAVGARVKGMLSKPFDARVLVDTVREHCVGEA